MQQCWFFVCLSYCVILRRAPDAASRAEEKKKGAEAAAEAAAAALRQPDVISGATARSAPADTAPAVCQVCGAQFLSKTKVCISLFRIL
jgi:hypothetical protein